jgi:hypothetical protein
MPVINGVYLKDFTALPGAVADADIIPIAITGDQIAYRTTVAGIVTDARITAKLLTGLSVTGGAVIAADTILEAFGKVQNQINGKQGTITLTTTGTSGAATFVSNTLNIPNYGSALTGYVPYTGATTNVALGIYNLSLSNLAVNNIDANNNGANDIGTLGGNTFRNVYAASFVKTGGTSSQFLKADGSSDTTTYQGAITLTTTGTSGAATLVSNTLNIPNYADGGVLSLSPIGSTPNSNAANITGTVLNLQPADALFGGVVTTGAQTFAGSKTFNNDIYVIGGAEVYGLSAIGEYDGGAQIPPAYGGNYALTLGSGLTANGLSLYATGKGYFVGQLRLDSTITNGTYTYTLPSATGTLALTSALTGYLPLTGGTLTGALNGTSASFSSNNFDITGASVALTIARTTGSGFVGNATAGAYVNFYGATHATKANKVEIVAASGIDIQNALSGTSATFSGRLNVSGATDNSSYVIQGKGNVSSIDSNNQNTVFLAASTTASYLATSWIGGGGAVPLYIQNNGINAITVSTSGYTWINGAISGFTGSGVQFQVNGQSRMGGTIILHNTSNAAQTATFNCTAASTVTIADNVVIVGSLSKGSGSFRIEHPLPSLSETHQLVHSFIEGPKADLILQR